MSDPRNEALKAIGAVIRDGRSLAALRDAVYQRLPEPRDRAFCMQLLQGVLRWRWKLDAMLGYCLQKPLRNKEHEVRHLLYMALFEISQMDTPDYAVVDEAVKRVRKLRKQWAGGLVNAVLRNFIRQRETIEQALTEAQRCSHPEWLRERLQADWPDHWQALVAANNVIAANHLRCNQQRCDSRQLETRLLAAGVDVARHPLDASILVVAGTRVDTLPGFDEGWFSVQDAGAQRAAGLLALRTGQRVLDLCAAPGGKCCHLLELNPGLELLAVDIDAGRLQKVEQNLQRLGLEAGLLAADASQPGWYQGELFDAILLDAPCSATGVIRRHPDIKSLRQADDIAALVSLQQQILAQAWPLLRPGGQLLYVTCSVLRAENSEQIAAFLEVHADASELALGVDWGIACTHGRQLLPGASDTDGFYYALLQKAAQP